MSPKSPPKLSLKKRLLFSLVLLLLCYALLEGAALLIFTLSYDEGFSPQHLGTQKHEIISRQSGEDGAGPRKAFHDNRVFHPYMGHVNLPDRPVVFDNDTPVARLFAGDCRTNSHGFFGPEPGYREPNSVQVVITGGSVANLVYCYSRVALAQELQRIPRLAGKKIIFTGLAFCGFRQPQQLMALAYYAAQGQTPDLLINLDGFNEVASHEFYDYQRNQVVVYPQYPQMWSEYFLGQNPAAMQTIGMITFYKKQRARWAEATGRLEYSILGNLLWSLGDRYLADRANEQRNQLRQQRSRERGYNFQLHGPRISFPDRGALDRFNARTWYHSAMQLARMARAGGYRYFHFLQPNLHLPGSKILTPREQKLMKQGRRLGRPLLTGYPRLRKYGAAMKLQGVQFHDLSQVFVGHSATVAADDCCHFTRQGDAVIARAMGRIIRQQWLAR